MFAVPKKLQCAIFVAAASLVLAATAMAGTVTISSPSSGQTVSTSFHLKASASGATAIKYINVYVNGSKVASDPGAQIDKTINTSSGSHKRLTIQAVTSGGGIITKTIYINVSGSSGGAVSSAAHVLSSIEQMTGWASCTVCAGPGGSGTVALYSMSRGVSSPSMDGKSAKFHIGGSKAYSAALWWKQLGAKPSAHHFVYDTYFYLKNPTAAQALEFDVNQSVSGKKYIFGTECDIKGGSVWRVWAASKSWISTGIHCGMPSGYKWHHLVLEFQRTTGSNVKFISVSVDGAKHYINRTYAPKRSGASELNVAFQMDGNRSMTDYDVWLDKVKLSYW